MCICAGELCVPWRTTCPLSVSHSWTRVKKRNLETFGFEKLGQRMYKLFPDLGNAEEFTNVRYCCVCVISCGVGRAGSLSLAHSSSLCALSDVVTNCSPLDIGPVFHYEPFPGGSIRFLTSLLEQLSEPHSLAIRGNLSC